MLGDFSNFGQVSESINSILNCLRDDFPHSKKVLENLEVGIPLGMLIRKSGDRKLLRVIRVLWSFSY